MEILLQLFLREFSSRQMTVEERLGILPYESGEQGAQISTVQQQNSTKVSGTVWDRPWLEHEVYCSAQTDTLPVCGVKDMGER